MDGRARDCSDDKWFKFLRSVGGRIPPTVFPQWDALVLLYSASDELPVLETNNSCHGGSLLYKEKRCKFGV